MSPKRFMAMVFAAAASAFLASASSAQAVPTTWVPGGVTRLELDLATGNVQLAAPAADALLSCYDNAAFSGFIAVPNVAEEWVDWGAKVCGTIGLVSEVTFGYGTTALDPSAGGPGAALEIALFAGPSGACLLGAEMARYAFEGLPGSPDGVTPTAFTVEVDVHTAAFPLKDGAIAWSYVGVDGLTGPLLVKTAGACGGAPDPATGTADCFDLWTPTPPGSGSCAGTFSFDMVGVGSFYLELREEDGSVPGSQEVRLGAGTNPGTLEPGPFVPAIGALWEPTISVPAVPSPLLDFLGIATVPHPGLVLPGFGEILIGFLPPNPVVILSGPAGIGSPFAIPIPLNTALAGVAVFAQAGQVDAGAVVKLTNALDVVLSATLLPCEKINPMNTVAKFRSKYANVLTSEDCPAPSADQLAAAIAGALAQAEGVGNALCDQLGQCPPDQKCKLVEPSSAGVGTSTESLPDPSNPDRMNCYVVVNLTLNGKCMCE
jgi:hypothetical protein